MKIKLMPMLAGALVLGALATPFAVNAQANQSAQRLMAQTQTQQRQGKEGKWAALNLTDAQKQQISAIKQEMRAEMQNILTAEQQAKLQAAMQNGQGRNRQAWKEIKDSLTDEQKAQMRALMEKQKARIENEVLTAEQKQQLEQMRQQWQQRRQQRQQQSN